MRRNYGYWVGVQRCLRQRPGGMTDIQRLAKGEDSAQFFGVILQKGLVGGWRVKQGMIKVAKSSCSQDLPGLSAWVVMLNTSAAVLSARQLQNHEMIRCNTEFMNLWKESVLRHFSQGTSAEFGHSHSNTCFISELSSYTRQSPKRLTQLTPGTVHSKN